MFGKLRTIGKYIRLLLIRVLGDLSIDDVYNSGVPYHGHEYLTRYHILYRANGKFYVLPGRLAISPGGKVVLKDLIPGLGV